MEQFAVASLLFLAAKVDSNELTLEWQGVKVITLGKEEGSQWSTNRDKKQLFISNDNGHPQSSSVLMTNVRINPHRSPITLFACTALQNIYIIWGGVLGSAILNCLNNTLPILAPFASH